MSTVFDVLGLAAIGLGLLLASIGLLGMLRMPDVFSQLHAAGLVTGPAVILVLLASLATANDEIITSAVLVLVFVAVTSPLSAHAIAHVEHEQRLLEEEGETSDEDGAAQPPP